MGILFFNRFIYSYLLINGKGLCMRRYAWLGLLLKYAKGVKVNSAKGTILTFVY